MPFIGFPSLVIDGVGWGIGLCYSWLIFEAKVSASDQGFGLE